MMWEIPGSPTSRICSGGDFDRDGVTDLLLVEDAESVAIISGVNGNTLAVLEADQSFGAFGCDVAASHDVDMDGTNDILVGGWDDDGGPHEVMNDYGKVWLFSGADGQLLGGFAGRTRNGLGEGAGGSQEVLD